MDIKTKELIAIGAAVTANCVPCLKYHVAKAKNAGVSDHEITEAIDVGRLVRQGAARKWDEEANQLLGVEQSLVADEDDQHPCRQEA